MRAPLRIRLLRLAARRPLGAAALALTTLGLTVAALVFAVARPAPPSRVEPTLEPRAILSRVWLDAYPDKRKDVVDLWIFLSGGLALHETGSVYRASYELFEFERQGDKLVMRALQDDKKSETRFAVERCDDKDQFDACLTFVEPPPGGKKRYYGWVYDDDMDRAVPWGRKLRDTAEAMSKTAR